MKKTILSLFLLFLISVPGSSKAATLGFNYGSFPNSIRNQMTYQYQGFSWYNFRENFNKDLRNIISHIGSIPLKNSSITSLNDDGFLFDRLDLRGESRYPITVSVLGYFHGNESFSFTQAVTNSYFPVINTDYANNVIDKLVIDWAGSGSSIHIDNFTYTPVPEPSTLIMGIIGISGVALRRFRAASAARTSRR